MKALEKIPPNGKSRMNAEYFGIYAAFNIAMPNHITIRAVGALAKRW